jgi:hypothetical protein
MQHGLDVVHTVDHVACGLWLLDGDAIEMGRERD